MNLSFTPSPPCFWNEHMMTRAQLPPWIMRKYTENIRTPKRRNQGSSWPRNYHSPALPPPPNFLLEREINLYSVKPLWIKPFYCIQLHLILMNTPSISYSGNPCPSTMKLPKNFTPRICPLSIQGTKQILRQKVLPFMCSLWTTLF